MSDDEPLELPAPAQRQPVSTLTLGLLLLALIPYGVLLSNIGKLHYFDPEARTMASLYTLIAAAALWLLLGALLVNAAITGPVPLWSRVAAVFLHPASLIASILALDLIASDSYHAWALATPAIVPPLIGAYALWAGLPKIHGVMAPHMTSGMVWVVVLGLTTATIGGFVQRELRASPQQSSQTQPLLRAALPAG